MRVEKYARSIVYATVLDEQRAHFLTLFKTLSVETFRNESLIDFIYSVAVPIVLPNSLVRIRV